MSEQKCGDNLNLCAKHTPKQICTETTKEHSIADNSVISRVQKYFASFPLSLPRYLRSVPTISHISIKYPTQEIGLRHFMVKGAFFCAWRVNSNIAQTRDTHTTGTICLRLSELKIFFVSGWDPGGRNVPPHLPTFQKRFSFSL